MAVKLMGRQGRALDVALHSASPAKHPNRQAAYSVKVATLLVTPLSTSVLFRGTYCCVMILIISCDAMPPRNAAMVWSSAPPYRHLKAKDGGEPKEQNRRDLPSHFKDTLDSHLLDMLLRHTRAEAPFGEQLLDAVAQVGNIITADLVHACVRRVKERRKMRAEMRVANQAVRSQRPGID